jgi:hypothetical protein
LAAGLARGAAARGRRIAFGDREKIIWDKNSPIIFSKNKNIAIPGSERDSDIDWVPFYRGNRLYNTQGAGRWIWNYEFRATPGEIYFHHNEQQFAKSLRPGFVLIEPNVPWYKSVAPNKDWGAKNYQAVADKLRMAGYQVAQPSYGKVRIRDARVISTTSFRHAAIAMSRASLYIGPEGGLHHAAAATKLTEGDNQVLSDGTKAVVLFGGFIPPQVTGYDTHVNLTGGAEACGSLVKCEHCRKAMANISVEEVLDAALNILKGNSE